MKKILFNFIFISILFTSHRSYGTEYRVFAGLGINFIPVTYRIGINDWEFGLLGPGVAGVCRTYNLGGLPYVSFGPSLSQTLGFFGAMGLLGDLFWGLRWRTELQSSVSFGGFTTGTGIIGLDFKF